MTQPAPAAPADVRRAACAADLVFGACGVVALAWEVKNILNRVPGDTLSERTRVYFRVKGKTGAAIFIVTLGSAQAWFLVHILKNVAKEHNF